MMSNKMKGISDDDEIRDAFKAFDKDGDGVISAAELKQVMAGLGEKLSEKEIEDMIKAADTDKNGVVDYEE